jgi:sugar phosphate isomerase/epimerase
MFMGSAYVMKIGVGKYVPFNGSHNDTKHRATHAPSWSDVWNIVKKADRPNIGLCLDTFQTAGGEWGDPTTDSGRIEGLSEQELEERYKKSLQELSRTIPKDKIYLLQISDAYKPSSPLGKEKDDSGLRPRGRWSHDHRPLPFDGGYLPIVSMTRAVLETGFRGWFSIEVFDSGADGKKKPEDPDSFAKKGMESYKRLIREATS